MAAFSATPFGGNSAVVVHGAEGLDDATRMKVVLETSLVECTFLEKSDLADIRFRIYLARREVPFAGHPTLAGVASMLHRGLVPGRSMTVETKAGIIPVDIDDQGRVVMQQIAPVFGPMVDAGLVAETIGVPAGAIIAPPQVVSTGFPSSN